MDLVQRLLLVHHLVVSHSVGPQCDMGRMVSHDLGNLSPSSNRQFLHLLVLVHQFVLVALGRSSLTCYELVGYLHARHHTPRPHLLSIGA